MGGRKKGGEDMVKMKMLLKTLWAAQNCVNSCFIPILSHGLLIRVT